MVKNNPYQPPLTVGATSEKPSDAANLREIASAQRQVNIAVLLYLSLVPINIGLSIASQSAAWAGIMLGIIAIGVIGFGAVSVYKLASVFHGKTIAVIHALGLLVPLLGIILLFMNSQKATKILQANGVKVGLLGANPKLL